MFTEEPIIVDNIAIMLTKNIYTLDERARAIKSESLNEFLNLAPLVRRAMFVQSIVCTSWQFDPVINKTFSFILAMDWKGIMLTFLVVSKLKKLLIP